jgi:hypothetical protein
MPDARPCAPGTHLWEYETTLTPPVSGRGNVTIHRCRKCSYSWDGAAFTARAQTQDGRTIAETVLLTERTPTPREAAGAVVGHYTGVSIPGVKNVEARNRRLRRRLSRRLGQRPR